MEGRQTENLKISIAGIIFLKMSRSVIITTPIPTLDEVAKDLGIGKARRDSLIRIMTSSSRKTSRRQAKNGSLPPQSAISMRMRGGRGRRNSDAGASR